MAKYYIESGNVRTVISAEDPEKAALWVIHKALQQVLPVYEDEQPEVNQKANTDDLMVLGNKIRLTETGFECTEAVELETLELVNHWTQLMLALEKLEKLANVPAA